MESGASATNGDDVNAGTEELGESTEINCIICNVTFSGVTSYENHINGKKHYKMVKKLQMMKKFNNGNSERRGEDTEATNGSNAAESGLITCLICKLNFSGYTPYAQHLQSKIHSKNVGKKALKDQFKNMPEVLDKETFDTVKRLEESTLQNVPNLQPYARCDTCSKSFSGPESFQQHVTGSSHEKKVLQLQIKQDLQKKHLSDPEVAIFKNENPDTDSYPFGQCKTCQKCFTGPESLQQHMQSLSHKKKLQKVELKKEMMSFAENTTGEEGDFYKCEQCSRHFSDPVTLQTHFISSTHKKQIVRNEIIALLAEYNEITEVASQNGENELRDIDRINEKQFGSNSTASFFICTICHSCFSGPESAKDHVQSKKHHKAKLQMQKLKLLRGNTHSLATGEKNSETSTKSSTQPNDKMCKIEDVTDNVRKDATHFHGSDSNGETHKNAQGDGHQADEQNCDEICSTEYRPNHSSAQFKDMNRNTESDENCSILSDGEFELI